MPNGGLRKWVSSHQMGRRSTKIVCAQQSPVCVAEYTHQCWADRFSGLSLHFCLHKLFASMAHTQDSHLAARVLLPHCIKNTAVLNEINLAAGLWMVELFLKTSRVGCV